MKSSIRLTLAAAFLAMTCQLAVAEPYAKDSSVAAFKSTDQHEKAFQFNPVATRYLLVSHDMKTGKKANAALDPQGAAFLDKHQAVYLANIHGMPGIGRMFAMPKMRKYAHRIILADDPNLIARFPESPGKVTVLELDKGKVASIRYWDPEHQDVTEVLK